MNPLHMVNLFLVLAAVVNFASGCGPVAVGVGVAVAGVLLGSRSGCGPCKSISAFFIYNVGETFKIRDKCFVALENMVIGRLIVSIRAVPFSST